MGAHAVAGLKVAIGGRVYAVERPFTVEPEPSATSMF